MTIDPVELERLSKAATQGEWEWDAGIIPPDGPGRYSDIYIIDEDREPLTLAEFNDSIPQGRDNARFIVALVNAYRARQVVPAQPSGDVVEAVKNAARYRWLRDHSVPPHNFYISVPDEFHGVKYGPDEVDAYIDAARAALGEKP